MRNIMSLILLAIVGAMAQPAITITPTDSVGDSTSLYLQAVEIAEVAVTYAARAKTGTLTRKGEREVLLSYWTAKASYHSAQAQFCAYVGDRHAAFAARRMRDEALKESYVYIPTEKFQVEHKKLRLDTQG